MGRRILILFLAALFVAVITFWMNDFGNDEDYSRMTILPKIEKTKEQIAQDKITENADTDEWRVYQKESKNLRFKFHKNWYYARDSWKEASLEYELFVGFADSPEILEKGVPYPVQFVIVPLSKKLEYLEGVEYATGTERGDKFYFFGTKDEEAYKFMVVAMARSFEFTNQEIMTGYKDENIRFSYPKMWKSPEKIYGQLERTSSGTPASWKVIPGLMNKTGCEGYGCPVFGLFGYENQDYAQVMEHLISNDFVQIKEEKVINNNKVIIFESSDDCRHLNAYVFNESDMVEIEARCGAENNSLKDLFGQMLESLVFIKS